MKMENTKHHRLTSFADTASEAPLQEPDRQDYFIEKAKDIFAEKCKEADRTLTFCVTTFGCQMNARDSEKLVGILEQIGYVEEHDEEKADFVIYNTCTVRENANLRVYGRLGQLGRIKKKNPHMMIALCGCMMQEPEVVEISALKGTGVEDAAARAIAATSKKSQKAKHSFNGSVEHAFAHIEELCLHNIDDENLQRWYAIKLFERDTKVQEKLGLSQDIIAHIEKDIVSCEEELDDDAESIITGERYNYIGSIINDCIKKAHAGALTTSDKIDRIVTNRILGLPIFAAVMWLVYYVSITTVGGFLPDDQAIYFHPAISLKHYTYLHSPFYYYQLYPLDMEHLSLH